MAILLYEFRTSSSSWRVRWALKVKGVPYRSVAIDLRAGQQRSDEHRARNPLGYVPTLSIDGRFLGESVAIIEFLDERIPEPPLYPRDAWARARTRQVVELVNSGIQPMQNLAVMERHTSELDEKKEWSRYFNQRGMEALERLLTLLVDEGTGGRFSVGDTLTAADLFVVPQVSSARRFDVPLDRYPRVLAVEKAALETEHAAAAHPDQQPPA